jgi:translation initiation factor 5A
MATEDSIENYDFSRGDAGASHVFPMEAGQIRKGGYIVIKGRPCKVTDVSTSKTGKHGHAKCNFVATDIFTNKKYEDIIPSTHATTVPNVSRFEYGLVDISADGFCSLMNPDGVIREDIKLPDFPENMAREIREAFESGKSLNLSVMAAMGHEQIIAYKEESA